MVTLTRRGLLARAGRLAPLAAAAGMLGRFAVPVAQPIEQEVLTIPGPYQIFFGMETVVLAAGSVPHVLPEWWGALGTD